MSTREGALPPLLTVAEVAASLRLSPSAVYWAVERGDLTAVRLTHRGALRVPAAELNRLLAPTTEGEPE